MNSQNKKKGVHVQIQKIRRQYWIILVAATGPFLFLSVMGVLTADSTEEKILVSASFVFGFGLALIATKVAAHTAIERQLSVIEDIDAIKSEFVAIAAHQLKTPVSAIKYSLEGLDTAHQQADDENFDFFLQDLKGSAHRLSLLTRNLLNVTLIDSSKGEKDFKNFPIIPRIEKIVDELEAVQTTRNVQVQTRFELSADTEIYNDDNLFYNVVGNLLSNAYKYAVKGTPVIVRASEGGQDVTVAISNQTEPTTQSEFDDIFEKFTQSTRSIANESDGFGLGLYICKKYVEAWGGDIKATLKSPTEIEFSFTVPKSSTDAPDHTTPISEST